MAKGNTNGNWNRKFIFSSTQLKTTKSEYRQMENVWSTMSIYFSWFGNKDPNKGCCLHTYYIKEISCVLFDSKQIFKVFSVCEIGNGTFLTTTQV